MLLLAAATPAVLAVDTSTTVVNVAPAVASASLSGLVSGALSPTSGSSTTSTITLAVSDDNGYQDIAGVTVKVRKPDGSIHTAASAATFSSGSLLTATYTWTLTMQYYDVPALLSSLYYLDVNATDSKGAISGVTGVSIATFNYNELAAVSTGASVPFGSSIAPGATTAAQGLAVANAGNVRLDVQLSGTSLAHATESASIAVGNVRYSTASDMSGSGALAASATTLSAFDLAAGSGASKNLYFDLTVPSGSDQWIPEGTYAGTLTVGGVKG